MYDVVVIGSGPGGYVAAIRGAQLGGKIAIVEAGSVGGVCLNRGCIPTKDLVRTAEVYLTARGAHEFGVQVGEVGFDLAAAMARKSRVVTQLVGGVEQLLRSNKIDVYRGWADVPAPGKVVVKKEDGLTEEIETKNIMLATGGRAQSLPISEASMKLTISSTDALELTTLPKSMVIIGGGVMGIEFGSIYNAFGTKVDIIERLPGILPAMDEEISRRLIPTLKKKGISINCGVSAREIVEADNGERIVRCDKADGTQVEFQAEVVLVSVGTAPNFGGIDLARLGVVFDRRGIKVDEHMKTSVDGIWAIGDVVGKYYLAHVASAEGIVAMENIFGHDKTVDYSVIPGCVFSIPEVASVGMTEKAAKDAGIPIKVAKFPFAALGRAVAMGETDGLVKIIADANDNRVLGMHVMGAHADDLIHEGAMALKMGAKSTDIAEMIHAHPTLAEATMEAAHGIAGQPIHLARTTR